MAYQTIPEMLLEGNHGAPLTPSAFGSDENLLRPNQLCGTQEQAAHFEELLAYCQAEVLALYTQPSTTNVDFNVMEALGKQSTAVSRAMMLLQSRLKPTAHSNVFELCDLAGSCVALVLLNHRDSRKRKQSFDLLEELLSQPEYKGGFCV